MFEAIFGFFTAVSLMSQESKSSMGLGIPLELVTMLGSGLLSGILSLMAASAKARQATLDMAIQRYKTEAGEREAIRRNTNPPFQMTRRIIALTAVFAIIVWPKIVAVLWPAVAVTVGYTEFNPGWLFGIIPGKEAIVWTTVHGLAITPLDTHLMSAIVGLYFGASVCKNA